MNNIKSSINKKLPFLLTGILFMSQTAFAGKSAQELQLEQTKSQITVELMNNFEGIEVDYIFQTPIDSIYQVGTSFGMILTDETGKYVINADEDSIDLYRISDGSLTDITEQGRNKYAQELMSSITSQDTITYKAESERYQVTVFTDVNCGYCQLLHSQIDQYNALGITINYLPFPVMGDNSVETLTSVWCSEDKKEHLTAAQENYKIKSNNCETVNLNKYEDIAEKLGATGTPFMVTESGHSIGGYLEPGELLIELTAYDSI